MDYTNILGHGNTALYITAPKKHYYLKVATSLESWFKKHIELLENEYFEREVDGGLSALLNIEKIYSDYIKEPSNLQHFNKTNDQFPTTSCTIKYGIMAGVQARFETIKSTVVPDNEQARKLGLRSEYFFVLKMNFKFLGNDSQWPTASYRLKSIVLKLT